MRAGFRRITPAVLAALWLSPAIQAGAVRFVDDDAPPAGDGLSWETAYRFLQDALAEAGLPGAGVVEIRVAQGTYRPDQDEANPGGTGDPQATFQLLDGVALRGGFAGLGAPDPDARDVDLFPSVLFGDVAGDDDDVPDACCTPHETPGCTTPFDTPCEAIVCDTLPSCCEIAWEPLCAALAVHDCDLVTECPDIANNAVVVTGSGTGDTAVLDGFTVTRGFCGAQIDAGAPTVLDCTFEANVRGLQLTGASPALTDCVIANNTSGNAGGGLHATSGDPVLTRCVVAGNATGEGGGGMASSLSSLSSLTLVDCTVSDNVSFLGGGGAAVNGGESVFTGCTFSANAVATESFSGRGGGLFIGDGSATVTGCTFEENTVPNFGGGLAAAPAADLPPLNETVTVSDCVFRGNLATGSPPGVGAPGGAGAAAINFSDNTNTAFTFVRCLFEDNVAGTDADPGSGGGIAIGGLPAPRLFHCTFRGNAAANGGALLHQGDGPSSLHGCLFAGNEADQGGALFYFGGDAATVSNCSFTGNVAGAVATTASSDVGIANSILWNDAPQEITGDGAVTVTFSDVQGGFVGEGNIDADPLFVDPAGGDLRLSPGSPCIDAADNTAVPPDVADLDGDGETAEPVPVDLDGNPRFLEIPETPDSGNGDLPVVDMGAFEALGGGCLAITGQQTVCHADGTTFTVEIAGLNNCTGGASTVSITASGGTPGEELCATVLVNDAGTGAFCCSTEICVTVPDCAPAACPCDLDGDGVVGIADSLALLSAWGQEAAGPPDLDGDGTVGVTDFLSLLAGWGQCPQVTSGETSLAR